jgi:hypothetical protein
MGTLAMERLLVSSEYKPSDVRWFSVAYYTYYGQGAMDNGGNFSATLNANSSAIHDLNISYYI